jgi:hypothetical protein
MRRLDSAQSIAIEYAKSLGIASDDKTVLEGLRSLPAEKVTEATDNDLLAIFGGPESAGTSLY